MVTEKQQKGALTFSG